MKKFYGKFVVRILVQKLKVRGNLKATCGKCAKRYLLHYDQCLFNFFFKFFYVTFNFAKW